MVQIVPTLVVNHTLDSRTELTINDLSESHVDNPRGSVPLENDAPLHASLTVPIEDHVKHAPVLWRPISVIVTDLVSMSFLQKLI
jgi:hypothetical protein